MNKLISIILILGIASSSAFAQASYRKLVKSADENFEEGNYYASLRYYFDALDRDDTDIRLWYRYGLSALYQHSYDRARMAFNHIVEEVQSEEFPDAAFYLADLSVINEDYDKAERYYQLYLSEFGGDDEMLDKKAELGLSSAIWAQQQIDVQIRGTEHLDKEINSPFSEHSPIWEDNRLNFVSLKYNLDKRGLVYSRVLSNEDEKTELMESGANFNEAGYLTSDIAYSEDGEIMFYTKCNYNEKDEPICKIYYRKKEGDQYTLGASAGNLVNQDGYTSTHPTIVEADGKMFLYFASTRPGGKGGFDLWYSEVREDFIFIAPENLDSLNTEFDDITPHFQQGSNQLFFSSNGREGFGSFDVYKSKLLSNHNFGEVMNLGMEVNSSYNDIHFYESNDGQQAYLSSNRKGSFYSDAGFETCCYDIYKVDPERCDVDLTAYVYDRADSTSLTGAHVTITEIESGKVVFDQTIEDSNSLQVYLDCIKDYEITASKARYIPTSMELNFSERGLELDNEKEEARLYLEPSIADLNLFAYDLETNEELTGVTIVLVDEITWLEETQTNPDSNTFHFSVLPRKSYLLKLTRLGYIPAEDQVSISTTDKVINKDVFLKKTPIEKKIVSLEKVLPIRLFFDNDQPNPRTMDTVTSIQYSETYEPYYDRKDRFTRVYKSRFSAANKVIAEQEIDQFFEGELKRNFDNLNNFMSTLVEVLEAGRDVNLYFRGYASPVAVSEYNYNLGKRRVESMLLELKRHGGGEFLKYIASGQLRLTERSFGESDAPSGISDDQSDPSRSIYSPEASFERRVEIEEIKVKRE